MKDSIILTGDDGTTISISSFELFKQLTEDGNALKIFGMSVGCVAELRKDFIKRTRKMPETREQIIEELKELNNEKPEEPNHTTEPIAESRIRNDR